MHRIRIVIVLLALASGNSLATSFSPRSLSELIDQGDNILVVTVTSGSFVYYGNNKEECPFFRYSATIEENLKGLIESSAFSFAGSSKLKIGSRYLIFVQEYKEISKEALANPKSAYPYSSWELREYCIENMPTYGIGVSALEIKNERAVVLDLESSLIYADTDIEVKQFECISEDNNIQGQRKCESVVKYSYTGLDSIRKLATKKLSY